MEPITRLQIRATKTLFEILELQRFPLNALRFVSSVGQQDYRLIWEAIYTLKNTADTDIEPIQVYTCNILPDGKVAFGVGPKLSHADLYRRWEEIYTRGLI